MKKFVRSAKAFVYWLGIRPSESSPLFSPRRDYRLQMGWA